MKSGTEENTMDFGNMMKLMGAWNTFKRNHPKFPAFCRAVHAKGLREDSVVEIIVTTPEGERIETSLKVKAEDLELIRNLTGMVSEMAERMNQKLKILYLMKILLEKTDETHSITVQEMITALASYGITAERKSLYSDLESLRTYGLDVIGVQENRNYYYHVGNRQFELAELKLLVDSVQSARFITARKSAELIHKIEGLASQYEASKLNRQVYVTERVKTMNESIYYNVDSIHTAISENAQIRFQYFNWNVDKEMLLRRNGGYYEISPWALTWNDENYYLVGYDSSETKIKHFRVDKMLHIEMLPEKREGREVFQE